MTPSGRDRVLAPVVQGGRRRTFFHYVSVCQFPAVMPLL